MRIISVTSGLIFLHEEKWELSQTSMWMFLNKKEDLLALARNQEKEVKELSSQNGLDYLIVEVGEIHFAWEIKEEKVSAPVSESSTSNPF